MGGSGAGPGDGDTYDVYAEFARKRLKVQPRPNAIPGILPVRRFLGRSQIVAVVLMSIHAYRTGLQFHLVARSRPGHSLGPTHVRLAERAGVPVVPSPQFDVTLADGTEAVPLNCSEAFVRLDALGDQTVGASDPDRPCMSRSGTRALRPSQMSRAMGDLVNG